MRIGILLPGFSSNEHDWAIPVQHHLIREMAVQDEVRVIALRYPHRRDRYPIFGAEVHSLGAGQVRGWQRIRLWIEAIQLIRRLHQNAPFDVLHAMWADETGLMAAWAGQWLGIPVVTSIAGGELVALPDIEYGLQRSAFSRWIVRQAIEKSQRVAAACHYTKNLLHQSAYHIPTERIAVIPLGVDTSIFTEDRSVARDPNQIIAVGSLIGVKNHAALIHAMTEVYPSARLTIMGNGSLKHNLLQRIHHLGLQERVSIADAKPHLEMPSVYQKSLLHVLPSRHEGLGMVTLEAAACGVTTLSTPVGIVPDYPELGTCVESEPRRMAQAINHLLSNTKHLIERGHTAQRLTHEQLTIQQTVTAFRKLYQTLQ
jgi:colanic acid/amylovoran biosynthesis glycosyltransferase